jgi:tetratricopeptide (TPR) repeat protein
LRITPNEYALYAARGGARFKNNDFKQAIAEFSQAILLRPKDDALFVNRAIAHEAKADFAASAADYTSAITIAPDKIELYAYRGAVYFALEEYALALADYTRVIENKRDYGGVFLSRAIVNFCLENYDAAQSDTEQALKEDETNADSLIMLGAICFFQNDCDGAIEYAGKAVESRPDDEWYQNCLNQFTDYKEAFEARAASNSDKKTDASGETKEAPLQQ